MMHAPTPALVQARIDTAAITHNVRVLAARIAPATLMSVVKADAYGHGLRPVVDACRAGGVRDFGVATPPEALALTDHLGTDPDVRAERVLCWLYDVHSDLAECVARGIELGIGTAAALPALEAAARDAGREVRVHVKLDTGLGRNGFTPDQLEEFLAAMQAAQEGQAARESTAGARGGIRIVGVMTHFAVADEPDNPFTETQLQVLDAGVERVREALRRANGALGDPERLDVHAANSPAALTRSPVPGTLARVGLATYGLSPFEGRTPADLGLRPALSLHSSVLAVKDVPAGHGASYGLVYTAPQDTRFALVGGGYADGIPRSASGRAEVVIHGRRYPQVGRVAMDQIVVDLGPRPAAEDTAERENPPVAVGDEVVLLGDGTTGPSAEEWGTWAGTVNYEIVTRLGSRTGRRYVHSEEEIG